MSDRRWGFEGERWGRLGVSEFDGKMRWTDEDFTLSASPPSWRGGGELHRSTYRKDVSQLSSSGAAVPEFIAA